MDNIHILCLSDIHVSNGSPANQGLVLREFFRDLPKVIENLDKDSLYCIIAGDLVQAGNVDQAYEEFYNKFLRKLIKYVNLDHIICTPGNHDLNRNILAEKKWGDKQRDLLASKEGEENFNESLKDKKKSLIYRKFACFDKFCKETLQIPKYDLLGYGVNVVPEVSIYCLNSALLSNGGRTGFAEDEGHLRVETSGLYEWAEENEGRTRVLVMHHPLYHLSEYVRHEIENILRKDVDILITGHLHQQDFKKYMGVDGELCKFCSSPQLFSDKHDQNGYTILHFDGAQISSIEYRKWSTISEEFTIGNEFSRTANGIIEFKKNLFTEDDFVTKELQSNLSQSLNVYNYASIWLDRKLSNLPPRSKGGEDEITWDHISLVNSKDNTIIVGCSQFGLTALCHKTILEAWISKHEHWLYVDGSDMRLSKVKSCIEIFVEKRGIKDDEIATIVLDNSNKTYDDKPKIIEKFEQLLPSARIVLINDVEDSEYFTGLNSDDIVDGYDLMYLRELDRKSIRKLTMDFMKTRNFNIDEDDKVLEKLIMELMDLNVHRTPVNCIQLLMNFQQNYESKPINRAKILSSLLQFFFLKPDSFYYTQSIDEDDCCIIMGALCEHLMRHNDGRYYMRYFTEDEFISATSKIMQRKYTEEARKKLLKSMIDAQVIVNYMGSYEFRFSYWVYYFAAYQMYCSDEFYQYMVDEQKCIFMPDIIEFYSGIDQKCDTLISLIVKTLDETCANVSNSLGVKVANPLNTLKCRPNAALDNKTQEQIEEDIRVSQLPRELKDVVADKSYDGIRPYSQAIETVMDKLNVKNMMSLARSASRAFRNSNLIDVELRNKLYMSIQSSWYSLFEVLVLLTPALAETGRGSMGGASFLLTEDFDEDVEQRKKMISIVAAIPFNIINWYRNDVFSDKRMDIYTKLISSADVNEVTKHLNILLLIEGRPSGWQNVVRKYIGELNKNSYYLGDVKSSLGHCYAVDTLSKTDSSITHRLIVECLERQRGCKFLPSKSSPIYIPKK